MFTYFPTSSIAYSRAERKELYREGNSVQQKVFAESFSAYVIAITWFPPLISAAILFST